MTKFPQSVVLRLYLALASLEGFAVLAALLSVSPDPKNAWLLGFSKSRILLAAVVLASALAIAGLAFWLHRSSSLRNNLVTKIQARLLPARSYVPLILSIMLILVASGYAYILGGQITDNIVRVRLERISPVLLWLFALCAQSLAAFPLLRSSANQSRIPSPWLALRPAIISLAAMLGLALVMSRTGLGLQPDKIGWDNFGVPVTFVQVVLAAVFSGIVLGLLHWVNRASQTFGWLGFLKTRVGKTDLVLFLLIWLLAMAAWMAEPLVASHFSPPVRPPNFEVYPYSDAALHDMAAQHLIIGEGYKPSVEKPLYSFLLAMGHLLVAQDYAALITLQTLVLALFPAVLYLLGVKLHHRAAGLLAAALVIFRERNAFVLSGAIRVSHSKMLMTDLPAALGFAVLALLLVVWLSNWDRQRLMALVSGGALGFVLLIRSQAIIFIPAILMGVVLVQWRNWKSILQSGVLFVLGTALVITPWMWRNYDLTGEFGYSQPNQAYYIAGQYRLDPGSQDPALPPGTPREEYTSLGFTKVREFIQAYPGEVAKFISAHFLHNEVSTLLIFPVKFNDVALDDKGPLGIDVDPFLWQDCCSLSAYLSSVPYWGDWGGGLAVGTRLAILVNIALLALGVGVAWRRNGWVGLVLLGFHTVYNASVAVARVSGWRLILPVDWAAILYYCIALGQISLWLWAYLFAHPARDLDTEPQPGRDSSPSRLKSGVVIALLMLAFAAIIPLSENYFPQRYSPVTKAEAESILAARSQEIGGIVDWQAFLADGQAVALQGRALFPRYYPAGEGEEGTYTPSTAPRDYRRLGFNLAGPENTQVVLPLDAPPAAFPNGADVMVLGCQADDRIQAIVVIFLDESGLVVESAIPPGVSCASQIRD
ncbi:MAG: hypothetical protein OEZ02_08270 [Anaerolineae bacterium]|nr:hypothetical protein [Anaerolineae bacterium]